MSYNICIDESGDANLNALTSTEGRFLALTGIIIEDAYEKGTMATELDVFKLRHFPSHASQPVILHQNDIVHKLPPFDILDEDNRRDAFDNDLLALLKKWDYTVVTICVDKQQYIANHSSAPLNLYHLCMAKLLAYFVTFAAEHKASGCVVAESRSNEQNAHLDEIFRMQFDPKINIFSDILAELLTSQKVGFIPKKDNGAGIQIADLLVKASRNEILDRESVYPNALHPFETRLIDILRDKYYRINEKVSGSVYVTQ